MSVKERILVVIHCEKNIDTMRIISARAIDYFKEMAKRKGVPYQTLINIFLNDCVEKKLDIVVA